MDTPLKTTLIGKLRRYLARGRQPYDPSGCLHCGRDTADALCAVCEELLARLEEPAPLEATAPPAPVRYINQRPDFVRRSDGRKGGRKVRLPFDDEAAG
jgi:hypothetical protein